MKSKRDIKTILSKFTNEELCSIYNRINQWEWDDRLGKMPENFNHLPNTGDRKVCSKDRYLMPYMIVIHEMVPVHDLLKYHHLYNLGKTEKEFERWWMKEKKYYLSPEEKSYLWIVVVLASVLVSLASLVLK